MTQNKGSFAYPIRLAFHMTSDFLQPETEKLDFPFLCFALPKSEKKILLNINLPSSLIAGYKIELVVN